MRWGKHNDKPGHGTSTGRERSVGWSYFLPFPLAATVIGCLKYGAGVCGVHVNNPSAEVFLNVCES